MCVAIGTSTSLNDRGLIGTTRLSLERDIVQLILVVLGYVVYQGDKLGVGTEGVWLQLVLLHVGDGLVQQCSLAKVDEARERIRITVLDERQVLEIHATASTITTHV